MVPFPRELWAAVIWARIVSPATEEMTVRPDKIREASSSWGTDWEILHFIQKTTGERRGRSRRSRKQQATQFARNWGSWWNPRGCWTSRFWNKSQRRPWGVQEGHLVQTEPGGSQAGHNHVTGGQCLAWRPLPTQHGNYEAILQHGSQWLQEKDDLEDQHRQGGHLLQVDSAQTQLLLQVHPQESTVSLAKPLCWN